MCVYVYIDINMSVGLSIYIITDTRAYRFTESLQVNQAGPSEISLLPYDLRAMEEYVLLK
uniref:Uncharacterized protein n=1 Tax=Octopus bimaculoides TaxID=37653 RepID=A0A0L8IBW6_OCTBM